MAICRQIMLFILKLQLSLLIDNLYLTTNFNLSSLKKLIYFFRENSKIKFNFLFLKIENITSLKNIVACHTLQKTMQKLSLFKITLKDQDKS